MTPASSLSAAVTAGAPTKDDTAPAMDAETKFRLFCEGGARAVTNNDDDDISSNGSLKKIAIFILSVHVSANN